MPPRSFEDVCSVWKRWVTSWPQRDNCSDPMPGWPPTVSKEWIVGGLAGMTAVSHCLSQVTKSLKFMVPPCTHLHTKMDPKKKMAQTKDDFLHTNCHFWKVPSWLCCVRSIWFHLGVPWPWSSSKMASPASRWTVRRSSVRISGDTKSVGFCGGCGRQCSKIEIRSADVCEILQEARDWSGKRMISLIRKCHFPELLGCLNFTEPVFFASRMSERKNAGAGAFLLFCSTFPNQFGS